MSKSKTGNRHNWKRLFDLTTAELLDVKVSRSDAYDECKEAKAASLRLIGELNALRVNLARAKRILEANAEHFDTLKKPRMAEAIRADIAELG
jgi:hypothetical protein